MGKEVQNAIAEIVTRRGVDPYAISSQSAQRSDTDVQKVLRLFFIDWLVEIISTSQWHRRTSIHRRSMAIACRASSVEFFCKTSQEHALEKCKGQFDCDTMMRRGD
jgi:hypothetical protein